MVKDLKKKKQCVALNIRNLEISSKQCADLKKKNVIVIIYLSNEL